MHVTSVAVQGLFGLFNHTIPLSTKDRITIIHGPNGYGKTVMLRMIEALIEGSDTVFKKTPFDEFKVTLSDGTARIVRRTIGSVEGAPRRPVLEFITVDKDGKTIPSHESSLPAVVPRQYLARVDRHVPSAFRLSESDWIDAKGTHYSLAEIAARFPEAMKALPKKYRPKYVLDEAGKGIEVLFVETNRLRSDGNAIVHQTTTAYPSHYFDDSIGTKMVRFVEPEEAERSQDLLKVTANSADLVRRIKSNLADYAKHSQERDRTFPERLVKFVRDRHEPLDPTELLRQMDELETKRQRLISLGMLDSEPGLHDLAEEDVKRAPEALTIYVGDVKEKLGVFDDVARRIGTLRDILNDRLRYKRLVVDRERGLRVVTQSDQSVDLVDLSSGEQHQLVVLYELLFRAPKRGLVLVDEPEISLHVAWQSRFLADLISVLDVTDSYAIVATHSPMIIGTHWDLTVELEGPKLPGEEE